MPRSPAFSPVTLRSPAFSPVMLRSLATKHLPSVQARISPHAGRPAPVPRHAEEPRLFPCHAEELRDEASSLRSGLNLPARRPAPLLCHAEEPRDEASSPAYNRQQTKKILRFAQDDRACDGCGAAEGKRTMNVTEHGRGWSRRRSSVRPPDIAAPCIPDTSRSLPVMPRSPAFSPVTLRSSATKHLPSAQA